MYVNLKGRFKMKQELYDLNFDNPFSLIDILNAENELAVPDKMVQLVKYCIEKIDNSGKTEFVDKTALPYIKSIIHVIEDYSHNKYSSTSLYGFKNRYYSTEYRLHKRLKTKNIPYDRFMFDKFIKFKIDTWSCRDFFYIVFRKLRVTRDFQIIYKLGYRSTMKESIKASIQMVEDARAISYEQLPSEYIKFIEDFTPEHTLIVLMITHILVTEISTQLKYIEYRRDNMNINKCEVDDGSTPEDSTSIAEIKKIAHTLSYGELVNITKWFDAFASDRIDKIRWFLAR